jgi:ribosomal protein S18 acetylase RimI-like enzyme
VVLSELSPAEFLSELDSLVAIYSAAMSADPAYLPGRLSIMERHAGYPGFRALVAAPAPAQPLIGFCYGFRGASGQWWHDVVRTAITARAGSAVAASWLNDTLEVAELHVRPGHQHQGTGRRLLLGLAAGRGERTAVLSTQDQDTPARRLYRSAGFTDLLTQFSFPGGGLPYAVMGAPLPLRGAAPAPAAAPKTPEPPTPEPPAPRPSSS